MPDTMIARIATAFLDAVAAQEHPRSPNPMIYRDGDDLGDVQISGQIDVAAAMASALAVLRMPTAGMTRAASDIPVGCCMTNASDAAEVWDYMIGALLAETA